MTETWQIVIILCCMGVLTILFSVVFVVVVLYLYSCDKLIKQIKTAEPELWNSLGNPKPSLSFLTSINSFKDFLSNQTSVNPFKDLISSMKFSNWLLKGGIGAELIETQVMVKKTKKIFVFATASFISLSILFIIVFRIISIMFESKGIA